MFVSVTLQIVFVCRFPSLSVQVRELLRAVEDVADLLPVQKVAAVEDGNAGKIRERGSDEEIIPLPVGADAGVGVPSGQYGIVGIIIAGERMLDIIIVASFITEIIEHGRPLRCLH